MGVNETKQETLVSNIENGEREFNSISVGVVEKQIKMIGLTYKDLQIINTFQPFVIENIDNIVDRFYKNLENEPSLIKMIHDNSSILRLKKTLRQHLVELFDGVIDNAYIEKRIKIAQIHVKIGLQTKWYMCAFQDLFLSFIEILEEKINNREDCLLTIRAISKIVNLEQQLVLEAYDAETERLKKEVEKQKKSIQMNIESASQNLATISEQTNVSFQHLKSQSNEIVSIANSGAKLSLLTQERAGKGKEIIHKQTENMSTIHRVVDDITDDVRVLLDQLSQMQEIVGIVTGIANQTNLLSLNAAIESARAGEYGRGFSVVAGEVRKLSDKTKESVKNVSNLILNTNNQVEKLTNSVEKIRKEVTNGNESMHESENYFEQILDTMDETIQENRKIQNKLVSFTGVVNELGKAFEEVALSADSLTVVIEQVY